MSVDLDKLQSLIGEWAETTFPNQRDEGIIAHLMEEAHELEIARDGARPDAVKEEAVDVFILLLALAHRWRFDLAHATLEKHQVNLERKWGEPNEQGIHHHLPYHFQSEATDE